MASRAQTDSVSWFTVPGYGVAIVFVVFPIMDTLAQVWPFSPTSPSWRYGTVGLGANYLISAIFGIGLACLIAGLQGHRRTLRILGWMNGILTALLLIAAILFVLDALEVRPGVPRDNPLNMRIFDEGVAKAFVKYCIGAVVLALLALACRRSWRSIPRESAPEVPVLVGRRSGTGAPQA